jgi:hypothetical protein
MKCDAFSALTNILCVSSSGRPRGDVAAQSVSIQLRRQVAETAGTMQDCGRKNGLSLMKTLHFVLQGYDTASQGHRAPTLKGQ